MPTLASLVTTDFDRRDAMLAALVACGIKTTDDVRAHNGMALMTRPPHEATVVALLGTKLHAKDNSILDDEAHRTALAHILLAVGADSSSSNPGVGTQEEKDRREADAFGQDRYAKLASMSLANVRAGNRIEGKLLKKASEDLDRGTLGADCYTLAGLKSVLAADTEHKARFAGITVNVQTEHTASTARNGEVLILIWNFLKMMLAAGMRKITPAAANPDAGSVGSRAVVKIRGGGGATERWHLTTDAADNYMLAAITGSTTLSPGALVLAHLKLQELIVDYLQVNWNYESGLMQVLASQTFATAYTLKASETSNGKGPRPPGTGNDSDKEMRDLRATNKSLQQQIRTLRWSDLGSSSSDGQDKATGSPTKKPKKGLCFDFNRGTCTRGDKCIFRHECAICGSKDHGQDKCPQK